MVSRTRGLSTNPREIRRRLAHTVCTFFLYSLQSEQKSDAPKDTDAPAAAPAPQVTLPSFSSPLSGLARAPRLSVPARLRTYTCGIERDRSSRIFTFFLAAPRFSHFRSRLSSSRKSLCNTAWFDISRSGEESQDLRLPSLESRFSWIRFRRFGRYRVAGSARALF